MLQVNENPGLIGEISFEIHDADETDYRIVEVHPWKRGEARNVYVSVGTYTGPDKGEPKDVQDNYWNIIVNREDFVEGLLAVFPELKRADDTA